MKKHVDVYGIFSYVSLLSETTPSVPQQPRVWDPNSTMRDPEMIETDLMEISAIADDSTKLERIIAWCAAHPDEIPFALHQLMGRRDKDASETE